MKRLLAVIAVLIGVMAASPRAQAYLGSFENADGYSYAFTFPVLDNWVDVTDYNAGQWGANAGGGGPNQITVNSGLWSYSSPAGSFFDTPTDRVTYMGAAPTFNPSSGAAPYTIGAYLIGGHFGGRTGNGLAVRNAATAGAIQYDYKLDSYDFGGVTPATVTSGVVSTSFYYMPNPGDNVVDSTGQPADKFIMSYADSTGSVGFQWGYLHDNSVVWRKGNSGVWNTTGLFGDASGYDGVSLSIDLTNQTFSLNYYDLSTNTTTNLANNVALGNTMVDYTHIGWWLTDNLFVGSLGGKNMFDDFAFTAPGGTGIAPEPGTCAVIGVGAVVGLLRRRRGVDVSR